MSLINRQILNILISKICNFKCHSDDIICLPGPKLGRTSIREGALIRINMVFVNSLHMWMNNSFVNSEI